MTEIRSFTSEKEKAMTQRKKCKTNNCLLLEAVQLHSVALTVMHQTKIFRTDQILEGVETGSPLNSLSGVCLFVGLGGYYITL